MATFPDWTLALPAVFTAAGLLGLGLGTGLLLFPNGIQNLGQRMNRWKSTRRATRRLELPHPTEPFVYRHHRLFGAVLVLGGIYAVLRIGWWITAGQGGRFATAAPYEEILLDASLFFLLAGNLAATLIGAFVFIRPSRLKGVEDVANQWVSTRRAMRHLEAMDERVDRFVLGHPRTAGSLFIVAGLYLLASAATINLF